MVALQSLMRDFIVSNLYSFNIYSYNILNKIYRITKTNPALF